LIANFFLVGTGFFMTNDMTRRCLFSIIESPLHPNWSTTYASINIDEIRFSSMRKALAGLKKHALILLLLSFFMVMAITMRE